jgi:hypothetical protein
VSDPDPSIESLLIDTFQAPEEALRDLLTFYYSLGLNDKKIATECLTHFDNEIYGLRSVLY